MNIVYDLLIIGIIAALYAIGNIYLDHVEYNKYNKKKRNK